MKNDYFLVESIDILEVSADIAEEVSTGNIAEVSGVTTVEESVVVSVVVELSLHATNAPIDKTNKNFFIVKYLVDELI